MTHVCWGLTIVRIGFEIYGQRGPRSSSIVISIDTQSCAALEMRSELNLTAITISGIGMDWKWN